MITRFQDTLKSRGMKKMLKRKKRNNHERIILAMLRNNGSMTKYDLADNMNISIPTVTANVNRLLKEGVIEEIGVADVEYGRKPMLIDINYNQYFSIGIDIQEHSIYYCLMNLKLELIVEGTADHTKKGLHEDIKQIVQTLLESYALKNENIMSIGVSYPGFVEEEKLQLKKGPNINISNISLEDLKNELGINIYVGNEARLAAFAESVIGVSKEYKNSIYISIKEGIGAGVILDKRYYIGSSESAGEIGHMVVKKDGKLCNCGNRGCIEPYLSINSLIESFNKVSHQRVNNLDELFTIYDERILEQKCVIKEYLEYLAVLINNAFLIFDPDCLIIGGKMSEYQEKIEPFFKEIMTQYSCGMLKTDRKIEFSVLGYKASKYGAALRGFEETMKLT